MKILLDCCVWGKSADELKKSGHDVVWAGDWDKDPGDLKILSIAHQQSRIMVTLDKDFGELAVVHQIAHSGIIRLVDISATKQAVVIEKVLKLHGEEIQNGAIVTVTSDRIRIRAK